MNILVKPWNILVKPWQDLTMGCIGSTVSDCPDETTSMQGAENISGTFVRKDSIHLSPENLDIWRHLPLANFYLARLNIQNQFGQNMADIPGIKKQSNQDLAKNVYSSKGVGIIPVSLTDPSISQVNLAGLDIAASHDQKHRHFPKWESKEKKCAFCQCECHDDGKMRRSKSVLRRSGTLSRRPNNQKVATGLVQPCGMALINLLAMVGVVLCYCLNYFICDLVWLYRNIPRLIFCIALENFARLLCMQPIKQINDSLYMSILHPMSLPFCFLGERGT